MSANCCADGITDNGRQRKILILKYDNPEVATVRVGEKNVYFCRPASEVLQNTSTRLLLLSFRDERNKKSTAGNLCGGRHDTRGRLELYPSSRFFHNFIRLNPSDLSPQTHDRIRIVRVKIITIACII